MRRSGICFVWLIFWVLWVFSGAMRAQSQGRSDAKAPGVEPVPPQKLTQFLIDLKGWEADGPPDGAIIKTRQGRYSEAERYYI